MAIKSLDDSVQVLWEEEAKGIIEIKSVRGWLEKYLWKKREVQKGEENPHFCEEKSKEGGWIYKVLDGK